MNFVSSKQNFLTWKYILVTLLIYTITQSADAQTTNTSTFTFVDFAPNIPSTATKTFTTSLTLLSVNVNQFEFDEGVFINSTNQFYSSKFPGFTSVTMISNSSNNSTNEIQVSYEIKYNYTLFIASGSSEAAITNQIGNSTSVKSGLESISIFSTLYNVSSNETTFSFSSNQICPAFNCGSSYAACFESTFGLTPICRSICFSTFTCSNDGVCVHRSPTLSPNCNCIGSASIWYIGGYCEYKVEVWMIVVFIIGFLILICLILLIGWLCCRKRAKSRQKQYMTTAVQPKKTTQNSMITRTTNTANTNNKQKPSGRSGVAQRQQSNTVNEESDIGVLGSPMTSAALVTVQESTSASDISTRTPEFYPEPPDVKESVQPPTTTLVGLQSAPAAAPESDDESSDSSESESPPVRTVSPSSSGSENQTQRYDSLRFPDTSPNDTEIISGYRSLDFDSLNPWEKGTQTNTRIDIILPDSILMQKM
ncbi:uncharacterized protein LOC120328131 isoform X1 [Styela clava]